MFERFTDRARRVVTQAQDEARRHRHNYIGTEHILLGVIDEGEGAGARALVSLGIGPDAVRKAVDEIIGQGEHDPKPGGHIRFTPQAKKVLELSLREALQLGHNYIGTEHILLGLIREGDGVGAQVLVKLGVTLGAAREQVVSLVGIGPSGERAAGPEPRVVVGTGALEDILGRLESIAKRLDAIERHLGMGNRPGEAGETGETGEAERDSGT